MPRHMMTGRCRRVGTALRKMLPRSIRTCFSAMWKRPPISGANEKFKEAELSDLAQVEASADGVRNPEFRRLFGRGPGIDILQSIIGGYNRSSARKEGCQAHRVRVSRITPWALSAYQHIEKITDVTARPDAATCQQGCLRARRRRGCMPTSTGLRSPGSG